MGSKIHFNAESKRACVCVGVFHMCVQVCVCVFVCGSHEYTKLVKFINNLLVYAPLLAVDFVVSHEMNLNTLTNCTGLH